MAATRKGLGSDDIPVHIPLECLCVPLSKTRRSLFTDNIYFDANFLGMPSTQ